MKLEVDALGQCSLVPLRESDPLPPDNRVCAPRALALDSLYRARAPKLLSFFSRRATRQEADDLVHETFVRLADADQRQNGAIERPEAYLSQVATNILRNRARAAFYRSTVETAPDDLPAPTDFTAALEARDMLNRLQTAMLKLNPKTREIFMAHRLDGATYGEIAERTGLSVKTIEWHMSKAIAALRCALKTFR